MLLADFKSIAGADISISNSKMPGSTFGLSTDLCKVGGQLRKALNTVCSKCYARRLEAFRPGVHEGYLKRTAKVLQYSKSAKLREVWAQAMAWRIRSVADRTGVYYHRWHDSGDLQSLNHLKMIVRVAELSPKVKHWIPTKEYQLISSWGKSFPRNLCVRVSAPVIDVTLSRPVKGTVTSSVHKDSEPVGFACPSLKQGNQCLDCRACWNRSVRNVGYLYH